MRLELGQSATLDGDHFVAVENRLRLLIEPVDALRLRFLGFQGRPQRGDFVFLLGDDPVGRGDGLVDRRPLLLTGAAGRALLVLVFEHGH